MVAPIRMSPTSKAVGRDQQGKCQQHRCHCSPRMRTWTPWTHHAQIKESRNSTHILIISNHILVINSYHWKSLKINMTCGFPNPPALQVLCVWHTNNHSFLGREDCSWNWNVFFFDVFIYSCINRLLQLLSSQMKLCLKVHTRPFALLVFFMFFFLRVCNVFLGERTYRPNSSNPILDPNL